MTSHAGNLVVHELMWVYMADPPLIDNAIYAMWVDGLTEQSVSHALQSSYKNVDGDLILKHVEDQYKLFVEMRSYLASPWLFNEHRFMFHVDAQLRSEMLEKYYTFDPTVVREFLGKRLTEKTRFTLTDLSNKAGVLPPSTVRQFENLRRIIKRATNPHANIHTLNDAKPSGVDDSASGSVPASIKEEAYEDAGIGTHHIGLSAGGRSQDLVIELMAEFQLPKRLARKYARIVYAGVHQFELDKKKLSHLKYKDIDTIISYMIKYWGSILDDQEGPVGVSPPSMTANSRQSTDAHRHSEVDSNTALKSSHSPSAHSASVLGGSSSTQLELGSHSDGIHGGDAGREGNFETSGSSHHSSGATPSSSSAWPSGSDTYPMLTPHPKMVSRLNHIKALASSHKTETNKFADEVRQKLGDWTDLALASSAPDPSRQSRSASLVQYKFIKAFLIIGASLSQSKDFKKIFSEILETIVQPCIDNKMTSNEIEELFRLVQVEGQSFIGAMLGTTAKVSSKRHLAEAWINYIDGLMRISLVMGADGG